MKLNLAFSAATERYEPHSIIIAKGIHSRAVLMRDLGDLTEASRLLPQALKTIKDRLGSKNVLFAEILGTCQFFLRFFVLSSILFSILPYKPAYIISFSFMYTIPSTKYIPYFHSIFL